MIDMHRRGFLTTMLASAAAPTVLYRGRAAERGLPEELVGKVPADEEVVAYEDGIPTGQTRMLVASVKQAPLRIERGQGIKYLAHGPDRSVYLGFVEPAPRATVFMVPSSENALMLVIEQTSRYVRVGACRMLDGRQVSVDFDVMILQHV